MCNAGLTFSHRFTLFESQICTSKAQMRKSHILTSQLPHVGRFLVSTAPIVTGQWPSVASPHLGQPQEGAR